MAQISQIPDTESVFKNIGQILQEEITLEENRQIASTMNNPVSSRSHVIACVKFVNTESDDGPLLIIGDLAGVENDFITDDYDMLKKFHEKTTFGNEDGQVNVNNMELSTKLQFKDNGMTCETFVESIDTKKDGASEIVVKIMTHYKIFDKDDNKIILKNIKPNMELKMLYFEAIGVNKTPNEYLTLNGNTDDYEKEIYRLNKENEPLLAQLRNKDKIIAAKTNILSLESEKDRIKNEIEQLITDSGLPRKQFKDAIDPNISYNPTNPKMVKAVKYHNEKEKLIQRLNEYKNVDTGKCQYKSLSDTITFFNNIEAQKTENETEIEKLKNEKNVQQQQNKNNQLLQDATDSVGEILYSQNNILKNILIEKMNNTNLVKQINGFKNLEGSINTVMTVVSKYIKELIYIQTQMSERQTEGKFINIELENIRTDILNGIITKSGGYTFTNPIMHNACLSTFCASKKKCFVIETPSSYQVKDKLDSELMKIIRTEMGIHTNDEFYQKLQFTIFTVFNIRQNTDNPPAQVYIDINDIKKELEQTPDSFESIILKMDKVVVIVNNLNNETLKSSVKTIMDNIKNPQTKNVKKHVNKFIEAIDKHNAITTLGTIIFTDNMAKFNTVNTLCDIPENNSNLKFSGEKVLIDSSKYEEDEKHFGDFQNAITYNASERDSDKYDVIYFNSVRKLRKSN